MSIVVSNEAGTVVFERWKPSTHQCVSCPGKCVTTNNMKKGTTFKDRCPHYGYFIKVVPIRSRRKIKGGADGGYTRDS
jgi:hypothetical protein